MANVFLRSTDGNDADDGTTWGLAKATLAGAIAVMNAGDTLFVSKDHAESTAGAATYAVPGSAASPSRVLCVDDTGDPSSPTTLATTATVTRTGLSSFLRLEGFFYCYGVTFASGSGGANGACDIVLPQNQNPTFMRFEQCVFHLASTTGGSRLILGITGGTTDDQAVELIDCTYQFGVTSSLIAPAAGRVLLRGGSLTGATLPTILVQPTTASTGLFRFVGMDLSALGAGKTLVDQARASAAILSFENCKLNGDQGMVTGTHPGQGGLQILFDNCDSADTNYRMERYSYQGSVRHETTIVRTGGASDGTTPIAWKMVSGTGAKQFSPLESPTIVLWNELTGSAKTFTVEIVHDSVTALKDTELWLEVEYLGVTGFPRSLFGSDGASVLAAGTNQPSSSVTWTTTGLTNPNKQSLAVTVTPEEKGLVRCKVMLGKASYTVYVDPKVAVS